MNRRVRPLPRLACALVGAALIAAAAPAAAQRKAQSDFQSYERCITLARARPDQGFAQALQWRNRGGGVPAEHCEGVALFHLGQYDEAAKRFHEVAEATSQDTPALRADAYEQAGQAWLMANEPQQARAEFDAALKLAPKNVELLLGHAQANGVAQDFWDAIDDLNAVLEIDPKRADALVLRASAYRRVEGYDLALEDASRAIELAPNLADAYLERGDVLAVKGDPAGARRDWLKVIEIAPDTLVAEQAKGNLAKLDAIVKGAAKPDVQTTGSPRAPKP